MIAHNTYIRKGSSAKRKPALYQFLQNNQFTVEFQLTDNYRKLEQKLIEQYNPIYNSHRAYTGLGAHKVREADYNKKYKEEYLEYQNQYKKQQCLYNGEIMTLCALSMRFKRQGIEHATIEAKKYLI